MMLLDLFRRSGLRDDPIEPMPYVKPGIIQPTGQHDREAQPQTLGPNQLAWLEGHHIFFGIHRRQAEAPVGVAGVQPKVEA